MQLLSTMCQKKQNEKKISTNEKKKKNILTHFFLYSQKNKWKREYFFSSQHIPLRKFFVSFSIASLYMIFNKDCNHIDVYQQYVQARIRE